MKYSYEKDLNKGENQYLRYYDLTEEKIVDARYVRSITNEGNIFIEALPRYLTPEQNSTVGA
jgi:hypothetical protein